MRTFRITVNGTVYDVQVDELSAGAVPVAAPIAAPAPKPAAAPKAAPVAALSGTPIKAPMPGTILDVRVVPGAAVKKGAVVMVLEAMKMENEIMAPADGTVGTVAVAKGAAVNSGDVLLTIN